MTSEDDLERCETRADLRGSSGERAAVVGTYERVDVRKARPGEPREPEYDGHVVVRLSDGTGVHLQPTWSEDGIRPPAEIERFEGERVRVVGTVHPESPEPPKVVAYIEAPCVRPVERIESVGGHHGSRSTGGSSR